MLMFQLSLMCKMLYFFLSLSLSHQWGRRNNIPKSIRCGQSVSPDSNKVSGVWNTHPIRFVWGWDTHWMTGGNLLDDQKEANRFRIVLHRCKNSSHAWKNPKPPFLSFSVCFITFSNFKSYKHFLNLIFSHFILVHDF